MKPSGRPRSLASCDSEYCYFAMQIGKRPQPSDPNCASFCPAIAEYSTRAAPSTRCAIVAIFPVRQAFSR